MSYLNMYSETSLIRPPARPTVSGLINEVALLLKTSLMRPFNKLVLLLRVVLGGINILYPVFNIVDLKRYSVFYGIFSWH